VSTYLTSSLHPSSEYNAVWVVPYVADRMCLISDTSCQRLDCLHRCMIKYRKAACTLPDDEHLVVRNMSKNSITELNHKWKKCASCCFFLQMYITMNGPENVKDSIISSCVLHVPPMSTSWESVWTTGQLVAGRILMACVKTRFKHRPKRHINITRDGWYPAPHSNLAV